MASLMFNRPIVTTELVLLELGNACDAPQTTVFPGVCRGDVRQPGFRILPLESRLIEPRP